MLVTLKSLPEDHAELRAVSERLMAEVQSQAYQIEKLKAELHGHREARFGSKSEGVGQLAFDLTDDEEIEAAATAQKNEAGSGDTAADEMDKSAKRKYSRKPLPDHLDRHDEVLSPGEACTDCGVSSLSDTASCIGGGFCPLSQNLPEQLSLNSKFMTAKPLTAHAQIARDKNHRLGYSKVMNFTVKSILTMAFFLLASIILADENAELRNPVGIYSGNIESAIGQTRVANWERWLEILDISNSCTIEIESTFSAFLSDISGSPSQGHSARLCALEEINAEFLILMSPSLSTLDSIDGVLSERRNGWVNRYANGDNDVSLTYTLTPLRPNFWSLTMTNHFGGSEFEGEELYLWARDYTSLSWIGARPSDVDGIANLQLISCTRPGCRAVYGIPFCRSSVDRHDVKIMARTIDEGGEGIYLDNFNHIHSLTEIYRQRFLEYSCQ